MIVWLKANESNRWVSFSNFLFLNYFNIYLLNVNEKLGQSVQNKLSLVDENVDLVLKEFLTVLA